MDTVQLDGLTVSAQGLGCMGMSEWYGAADRTESLATLDRALELGVTFCDTADVYGDGHNEELVGEGLRGRREQVQLATKFGIGRRKGDDARALRGAASYVRASAEASLRRLGLAVLDLY